MSQLIALRRQAVVHAPRYARRMAVSAQHLVETVFGLRPVRQWVLNVPCPLRFLFASKPDAIGAGKRPSSDTGSSGSSPDDRSSAERRRAMTWAQRLKRVFGIDATTCVHCGCSVRIVAAVAMPA